MLPLSLDDFDHYLNHHIDEQCKLSLILDYDGTLVQLASHPDLAVLPSETKKVLERLANMPDVNIAVISGRSLENLVHMVGIDSITYAGSHGLEILHPDGTKFMHPVPNAFAEKLRELMRLLQDEVTNLIFNYSINLKIFNKRYILLEYLTRSNTFSPLF